MIPWLYRLFLLLLGTLLLQACRSGPTEPEIPYPTGAQVLQADGMRCDRCERNIEATLMRLEGVEWTRAERELGQVAYTGTVRKEDVVMAIRELGYEVTE